MKDEGKKAKILTSILLSVTLVFGLTGCFSPDGILGLFINEDDLTFCFDYTELSRDVERAEIVYTEEYYIGGFGEITVVTKLDYETTLMLIEDFSKIQYITPILGDPPPMTGYCIRLWYKDGHYEVYDDSGTSVKFALCSDDINQETFDKLIEKYK